MNWIKPLIITIVVIFVIVIIVVVRFQLLTTGILASPPEIQRSEFPFRLEYEVDEGITVVEDALVVEFVGNDWNAGFGTHPTWKGLLKSGRERIVLFVNDETEIFYRPTTLSSSLGVFMGDEIRGTQNIESFTGRPMSIFSTRDGDIRAVSPEELYDTYNIKIINWEIAPPITNSFR